MPTIHLPVEQKRRDKEKRMAADNRNKGALRLRRRDGKLTVQLGNVVLA
jgi:hypothetical protein